MSEGVASGQHLHHHPLEAVVVSQGVASWHGFWQHVHHRPLQAVVLFEALMSCQRPAAPASDLVASALPPRPRRPHLVLMVLQLLHSGHGTQQEPLQVLLLVPPPVLWLRLFRFGSFLGHSSTEQSSSPNGHSFSDGVCERLAFRLGVFLRRSPGLG